MPDRRFEWLPLVVGSIAGSIAWVVGYAITFVAIAPAVSESPIHRFIEAFDGEPATYEMVGWVFYNAHFVNTVFRDVPIIGSHTTSFIGGEDGFSLILYVLPVGVLAITGFILARYRGVSGPTDGIRAGVMVLPGYLVVSIVGAFLVEVTLGGASGAPDLLPAVFVCGCMYPVVFGAAGGIVGGFVKRRDREERAMSNAFR